MPDSGITDGVTVFTSSFYDTYIRQQVIVTCTSGTRPTATEGRVIYETDTDRIYIYTGSAWAWIGGHSASQTYSPTLTNVTEGNGVKTGSYSRRDNRMIDFEAVFTLGSTSAITGIIGVSIPVTAAAAAKGNIRGGFTDSGSTEYDAGVFLVGTSRVDMYAKGAAGTYVSQSTATSSLIPFTWGTPDVIWVAGSYEAAAAT